MKTKPKDRNGKNNNNWKGGDYNWHHAQAKEMFGKDKCQLCGMTDAEHVERTGNRLSMHYHSNCYKELKSKYWYTVCEFGCHQKLERSKIAMQPCYWCGGNSIKKFKNGRYCCERHVNKCPAVRNQISKTTVKRHYHSKAQTLIRELESGNAACYYCGETATVILTSSKFCCSLTAYKCQGYKDHASKVYKQKYIDQPELIENMSKIMKKVQNRPEVKRKKSETMIYLHRDDCEKCVEFQENYTTAQKKRRKT